MSTNIVQQTENNKRYVVTVSFYMHAEDDKQVISQALKHCHELNKREDCRASVDGIIESKFGKIGQRKVY